MNKNLKELICKVLVLTSTCGIMYPYIISKAYTDGNTNALTNNDYNNDELQQVPHPSIVDNTPNPLIIDSNAQDYGKTGGRWVYTYGGPTSTSVKLVQALGWNCLNS